jgi:methionyl aminopeptidase
MTEKQYGGASSHGFKGKSTDIKQGAVELKKPSVSSTGVISDSKNEQEISADILKNYMKAGEIGKKVREFARGFVKKDMLLIDIAEKIEGKVFELGGKIAFPLNLSLNEIAAHYTPGLKDETKAEGLLKVDLGVEVGGFIADLAFSFDLTDDKKYSEMIKFNEFVLGEALKKLEVGCAVKIIGNTIGELVQKDGRYKVIRNLAGHGLDEDNIHAGMTISNLKNENNAELEDCAVAIEPFLTTGAGEIYEGKPSEIYVLQQERMPRDRDVRNLLAHIKENYRTKPFCKRWLEKAAIPKVNFCLSILVKEGIIYNFPVLVEKEKKAVSQAEHTIVFADKVYVTTE